MAQNNYTIVKTADGSMTTYRGADTDTANDAAICQALTEVAQEAWQYLTTTPGTYTAAQLASGKQVIMLREDTELPTALTSVSVECGTFRCNIGLKDDCGRDNYATLFRSLAAFESLARVKKRSMFTARMELGKLLCEARVVLPDGMKTICQCVGNDPLHPSLNYPAIDLDRRCIVATDRFMMVAKKFTLVSIHYEDKVPETFYMPMEVARMSGEVTMQLFERGCAVIDQDGVIAEVEHDALYPRWHTVWPKLRGGTTAVDSKAWTKVVKGAANGLPGKGKSENTAVLLTHYPASDGIVLRGYDGAEMVNEQRLSDCVATDEVAWRVPVSPVRLLKALALKPTMMWAGYSEYNDLPTRLLMEDAEAQMAVMIMPACNDDLHDALSETDAGYAAPDDTRLYSGYDPDGWLLEQIETKYPTCGMAAKSEATPEAQKAPKVFPKSAPKRAQKVAQKAATRNDVVTTKERDNDNDGGTELSLADRLRAALRARLVQAA